MSSVLVMDCENSFYLSRPIVTFCMIMKKFLKILAPIPSKLNENFEDGFAIAKISSFIFRTCFSGVLLVDGSGAYLPDKLFVLITEEAEVVLLSDVPTLHRRVPWFLVLQPLRPVTRSLDLQRQNWTLDPGTCHQCSSYGCSTMPKVVVPPVSDTWPILWIYLPDQLGDTYQIQSSLYFLSRTLTLDFLPFLLIL